MNGAVARTMMRGIMHIVVDAGCLYFRRCVFEVAVTHRGHRQVVCGGVGNG